MAFERTDDDDDNEFDGGGARFSFCNSFKWDVPLIIVELNWDDEVWEVWWSEVMGVAVLDEDNRSSSSANSHKLTLANVEQSFWRSILLKEIRNY